MLKPQLMEKTFKLNSEDRKGPQEIKLLRNKKRAKQRITIDVRMNRSNLMSRSFTNAWKQ